MFINKDIYINNHGEPGLRENGKLYILIGIILEIPYGIAGSTLKNNTSIISISLNYGLKYKIINKNMGYKNMIIKLIWPDCEFHNGSRGNKPIDSFWVECTKEEAQDNIFPFISEAQIKKAIQIESENIIKKEQIYFLISKDLKSIEPFAWYYPYSGLWNGYCPFKEINEVIIESLEEIRGCKCKVVTEA